jgi:hypothetical protein
MEVLIRETSEQASLLGAQIVVRLLRHEPQCVLGLATGRTPLRLYGELIRLHPKEGLDLSGVVTFIVKWATKLSAFLTSREVMEELIRMWWRIFCGFSKASRRKGQPPWTRAWLWLLPAWEPNRFAVVRHPLISRPCLRESPFTRTPRVASFSSFDRIGHRKRAYRCR